MSDDRSLTFLAKEDDSGKAIALLTVVVVLGLTFHAYSFFVIKNDEILIAIFKIAHAGLKKWAT